MTTAIERLQAQSDRQKIEAWLDHIGERDEACRYEVLALCKADLDARQYFVRRHNEDCAA